MAPAPAPMMDGPPPLPKASDALALTNSTLNQLQVGRQEGRLTHCTTSVQRRTRICLLSHAWRGPRAYFFAAVASQSAANIATGQMGWYVSRLVAAQQKPSCLITVSWSPHCHARGMPDMCIRELLPMQTLGTYQSDHVTPPMGVMKLLNSSSYQQALGGNPYYAPESFQYTLPDIFFQLDALGLPSTLSTHHYALLHWLMSLRCQRH